jgi:hypothetical protein
VGAWCRACFFPEFPCKPSGNREISEKSERPFDACRIRLRHFCWWGKGLRRRPPGPPEGPVGQMGPECPLSVPQLIFGWFRRWGRRGPRLPPVGYLPTAGAIGRRGALVATCGDVGRRVARSGPSPLCVLPVFPEIGEIAVRRPIWQVPFDRKSPLVRPVVVPGVTYAATRRADSSRHSAGGRSFRSPNRTGTPCIRVRFQNSRGEAEASPDSPA